MTKRELIKRWESPEGRVKLTKVINILKKGINLHAVEGLEKYAGRWDLRGAKLSKLEDKKIIESGRHKASLKTGSLKLKRINLESIDFTYSDLRYSYLIECNISNCIFEETNATEVHFVACNLLNCIFRKTNLSYSFINENIGSNSGSIKNAEFIESNLSDAFFYFPIIENCNFENCNLFKTDFDGSRFKDCKFKGTLDSLWFRGYSTHATKSILGIFNRVNPQKYPNKMINVDFTQSKLIGVAFEYSIDLSSCKFPEDENYILVKNLKETYSKAQKIIDKEWEGEDKRVGLGFIEDIYFTPKTKNQPNDLIDKHMLAKVMKRSDFADKFFDLIRSLNNTK